jgi:hypothetical protein
MTARRPIPAELERALMLEAGYRCAIPTCRTVQPLEIDHIEDYADVKDHAFHNMIVLCANCHRLKGTGPRSLDRKALRQLKANLGRINQRYNDTERRILEYFAENGADAMVSLPGSQILYSYLIKDGIIELEPDSDGSVTIYTADADEPPFFLTAGYRLTEAGRELIALYAENQPLP